MSRCGAAPVVIDPNLHHHLYHLQVAVSCVRSKSPPTSSSAALLSGTLSHWALRVDPNKIESLAEHISDPISALIRWFSSNAIKYRADILAHTRALPILAPAYAIVQCALTPKIDQFVYTPKIDQFAYTADNQAVERAQFWLTAYGFAREILLEMSEKPRDKFDEDEFNELHAHFDMMQDNAFRLNSPAPHFAPCRMIRAQIAVSVVIFSLDAWRTRYSRLDEDPKTEAEEQVKSDITFFTSVIADPDTHSEISRIVAAVQDVSTDEARHRAPVEGSDTPRLQWPSTSPDPLVVDVLALLAPVADQP